MKYPNHYGGWQLRNLETGEEYWSPTTVVDWPQPPPKSLDSDLAQLEGWLFLPRLLGNIAFGFWCMTRGGWWIALGFVAFWIAHDLMASTVEAR